MQPHPKTRSTFVPRNNKAGQAKNKTMRAAELSLLYKEAKEFLGSGEKGFTVQSLCTNTWPGSLFFKISWKRMSHLKIAGNQTEVGGG